MKRTLLAFLFGIFALSAMSQVQFSKFKFIKDEPFGAFRGRKAIDCKFMNTSDKPLKYVKVWFTLLMQLMMSFLEKIEGSFSKVRNT